MNYLLLIACCMVHAVIGTQGNSVYVLTAYSQLRICKIDFIKYIKICMATVSLMIQKIALWTATFSPVEKWLLNCALQLVAKRGLLILVSSGGSNAIVEMSRLMDLSGPGWTNVIENALEILIKYAADQMQCLCIRPRVSVKRTESLKTRYQIEILYSSK